jgi:hypothetical protein
VNQSLGPVAVSFVFLLSCIAESFLVVGCIITDETALDTFSAAATREG